MTRIVAAIGRILNASKRNVPDQGGDLLKKYLFISLFIHIALVAALSISYSRAIKPVTPSGPYEVSLVEFEKPKPETTAIKKTPPKKPEIKPEPVVKKEEEQPKEVVKIKPKPKKRAEEPKKIEPEPKQEQEKRPEQTAAPDSLLAESQEPVQTPGVGGFQVDSPNFNFNYYLELLRDKIQKNWKPPTGMPAGGEFITATVRFRVRRDGMIIGAGVEESSGLAFFDQSALRAVLNSNPAPPLPRAYDEDRLGVHVSFVFGEGSP